MTDLALFQTAPVAPSGGQMPAALPLIVNVDALNDSEKIRIGTARDALAPNTRRSYEKGLALCGAWLTEKGISEDQLTDELLSVFMLTESKRHPRTRTGQVKTGEVVKPGSVAVMFAAVKWYFAKVRQEKRAWTVSTERLKAIRRQSEHRERQVDGLTWSDVERVCAFAEMDKSIAGLRDSALIRLMSDCLLRVSEAVGVDVEDLKDKTLIVRSSKTDQEGVGETLYVTSDTRRIINRYRAKAGIEGGALFRRVVRGDHVQPTRLSISGARDAIKMWANIAGVEGFISGHSLRVGSAVSLAQAGASVVDMQVAGRWKSSTMPAHYAKAELAERGAIARFKEKRGKR